MANPDFIIVSVVCRGDLDSPGTKFHVDNYGVRNNRESTIYERVDSKFSMKVLQVVQTLTTRKMVVDPHRVPGIIRMHRNCGIAQHSFRSSSSNDNLFFYNGV